MLTKIIEGHLLILFVKIFWAIIIYFKILIEFPKLLADVKVKSLILYLRQLDSIYNSNNLKITIFPWILINRFNLAKKIAKYNQTIW